MSSRRRALHQLIPSLAPRDALGRHTLAVQRLLRASGWHSEVYAEEVLPGMEGRARPWREARWADARARPRYLYQGSTASPMASYLIGRAERTAVNFHDVTPPGLLAPWEPMVAQIARSARSELAALARASRGAIATSAFSESVLVDEGVLRTTVAAPLVDPGALDAPGDPARAAMLARLKSEGGADWLFVGRVAPHKAQHDLVAGLAAFRRAYDPRARLWLVGGVASRRYDEGLRRYVEDLGLAGAVTLTGSLSDEELAAHYLAADVFVCASEHEGFCIPLLEAMHRGLPVVAYASSAVPETLGEGGLLLAEKRPATLAAGVARLLADGEARRSLGRGARRRLGELAPHVSEARFLAALEELLGP